MSTKIIYKKLAVFYCSVYVLAAVLAVIGCFFNKNDVSITNNLFINIFKSIVIFYMLIIIPLALKKFAINVKKIAQTDDENEKFAKYLRISKIRIVLISIIFLVGIISFYTINVIDFAYIAAIGAIALIFCFPTKNKIENDLFNEKLKNNEQL